MLNIRIDLAHNTRKTSISLLQGSLSDAIDLRLAVKHAHWTVRDPRFQTLHELFDSFVEPLDTEIDEIAERIATLGGMPDGRATTVARESSLDTYPSDAVDGEAHLSALADRVAALGNKIRKGIDEADQAGDMATADLLTAAVRRLDQMLWFLEAHL